MFGKVIYIDKKKLNDFMSISTGKNVATVNSMQVTSDKEIGIGIPVLSAGIKGTKIYEASIVESFLYDIDTFEKTIEGRDDYFDFTISEYDLDLSTINRGGIIKFDGNLDVPAEFDMTQMIGQFKSMITDEITSNMKESEAKAFSNFLAMHNPKIPIITDLSNYILCTLIESENLQISYSELEDYESMEVTVLARVISNQIVDKSKPIFEPLKDFMSMNRMIRRQFANERLDGMNPIYLSDDYRKIEVIAIYQ